MVDRTVQVVLLALYFLPATVGAQDDAQSTRASSAATPALRLALKDAVAIALAPDGSARIRIAEEMLVLSRARSGETRAALLPHISAAVSYQDMTRNLEAFGLRLNIPIPGFTFPALVGPYSVLDARTTASQTILNLSSIRRYQAAKSGIREAEAETESAQDQTRTEVALAYLNTVRAEAILDAAQSDLRLAEAILKLAVDQKNAGTGTGIEITRANVQLANERQRLVSARNELGAARLKLLRSMHMDLAATLELTDKLEFVPAQPWTVPQALETALRERTDWRAQQQRLETARLLHSASRMERMPTLNFFADYGSIGSGFDRAIPTRAYGFSVQIPIFDGSRMEYRRAESASQYRQETIRGEDLRTQIELEIRLALDSLQSAAEQVRAAEEGLALAEGEVAQAERRYRAGASPGLEVTDAQTRLERARENRVAALFLYNVARIQLASATGTIKQLVQ
jgi:outer membrane protein